jgi:hypothetical protein
MLIPSLSLRKQRYDSSAGDQMAFGNSTGSARIAEGTSWEYPEVARSTMKKIV